MQTAPSFRHLEMFRSLMRTRSLTVTARELGVSQPAVSLSLREMENLVGFRLFERNSRRIEPTPHAKLLAPDIGGVVQQIEALGHRLENMRQSARAMVRVATVFSMSVAVLPEAVARFSADHVDARLFLDVHTWRDVRDLVAHGRADVGFLYSDGQDADVLTLPFMTTRLACILPEGHALAAARCVGMDDLRGQSIIVPNTDTVPGSQVAARLRQAGAGLGHVTEVNNAIAAINLVRCGIGIALCDPLLLTSAEAAQVVGIPLEPAIELTMSMILPKHNPMSPMTRSFIDAARNAASRTAAVLDAASIGTRVVGAASASERQQIVAEPRVLVTGARQSAAAQHRA